MAVFGKGSDPSCPARSDRSGKGFQPVSEDTTGKMPVLHKPAEPACLEAKFTLHSLLVDPGVVSSWSADSRRAIAHQSVSPTGSPNVACTMMNALSRHG
jgi:hypothetical protein